MRENEDLGLVFKTHDNAAQPAIVPAEVDGVLSDAVIACVADCIGELTSCYEKKIADLQTQVAELKGRLDMLTTLLSKGADVVQLPRKHG
jgi:hypothetical protein